MLYTSAKPPELNPVTCPARKMSAPVLDIVKAMDTKLQDTKPQDLKEQDSRSKDDNAEKKNASDSESVDRFDTTLERFQRV